jgi:hypothetical protein
MSAPVHVADGHGGLVSSSSTVPVRVPACRSQTFQRPDVAHWAPMAIAVPAWNMSLRSCTLLWQQLYCVTSSSVPKPGSHHGGVWPPVRVVAHGCAPADPGTPSRDAAVYEECRGHGPVASQLHGFKRSFTTPGLVCVWPCAANLLAVLCVSPVSGRL